MYSKPNGAEETAAYKRIEGIREVGSHSDLFNEAMMRAMHVARGGLFAEFGVFEGKTLRMIKQKMRKYMIDRPLYGFDSFEGLPEDYTPYYVKGKFKMDSMQYEKLKRYVMHAKSGMEIVPGYFEDTLEAFLVKHPGHFAFVHMDADLYSSTKFVLDVLMTHYRLVPGTVIQFDEMFLVGQDDDMWYYDEFQAWNEFVDAYAIEFDWIGSHTQRAAVVLTKVG